jgi:hypothetical protein
MRGSGNKIQQQTLRNCKHFSWQNPTSVYFISFWKNRIYLISRKGFLFSDPSLSYTLNTKRVMLVPLNKAHKKSSLKAWESRRTKIEKNHGTIEVWKMKLNPPIVVLIDLMPDPWNLTLFIRPSYPFCFLLNIKNAFCFLNATLTFNNLVNLSKKILVETNIKNASEERLQKILCELKRSRKFFSLYLLF